MGLDSLLHGTTPPLVRLLTLLSQNYEGYGNLSGPFIRFAHNSGILHEWVLEEVALKLSRADWETLYNRLIRKLSDWN